MKVILLDFDGVLNCSVTLREQGGYGLYLEEEKMEVLKEIVDQTGARIVLTTSWREHWEPNGGGDAVGKEIDALFARHGLSVFDKTPRSRISREEEIRLWLEENGEAERFAVLDDMLLYEDFLKGHFVKTSDFFGGLTREDAQRAIRILKGEKDDLQ